MTSHETNGVVQVTDAAFTKAFKRYFGQPPGAYRSGAGDPPRVELFSESSATVGDRVDRSFQTDARAEPERPDNGAASGASDGVEHAHRDG
jgi:hypothetical protein